MSETLDPGARARLNCGEVLVTSVKPMMPNGKARSRYARRFHVSELATNAFSFGQRPPSTASR